MRQRAGLTDSSHTSVYRLICAEGDFLPGLIVDYYNGTAVMQMHSAGMYLQKELIAGALKEVMGNKLNCIYNKSESSIPFKSGIEPSDEYLFGKPDTNEVTEHSHRFLIDWEKGQKTGFFIDQRENRKLLREYSANRKVLNMFGYTGGFSVYAMAGDAGLVHSVDSSAKAIDLTNKNIDLNFGNDSRHKSFAVDAFEFFNSSEDKYDLMILDPPAFAKHHNVLNNALQGYKKLNRRAIELINPGGIIFTFSCSQVVSKENFKKSVFVAAANTGRQVRILHQLTQPVDHPVNIYHPEGEYLKGLVLQVD
jgi:23S rRNA (cytosine1962-C5)-methyltransferase